MRRNGSEDKRSRRGAIAGDGDDSIMVQVVTAMQGVVLSASNVHVYVIVLLNKIAKIYSQICLRIGFFSTRSDQWAQSPKDSMIESFSW